MILFSNIFLLNWKLEVFAKYQWHKNAFRMICCTFAFTVYTPLNNEYSTNGYICERSTEPLQYTRPQSLSLVWGDLNPTVDVVVWFTDDKTSKSARKHTVIVTCTPNLQ